MWATCEVGTQIHSVAYVARQLGVAWHTVMDAVRYWGKALVADPARVGLSKAVGVDETKFLAAKRREPTRWASAICDFARRMVIDVIERPPPPTSLGSPRSDFAPQSSDGRSAREGTSPNPATAGPPLSRPPSHAASRAPAATTPPSDSHPGPDMTFTWPIPSSSGPRSTPAT